MQAQWNTPAKAAMTTAMETVAVKGPASELPAFLISTFTEVMSVIEMAMSRILPTMDRGDKREGMRLFTGPRSEK